MRLLARIATLALLAAGPALAADSLADRANAAMSDGRTAEAITLFRQLLQETPDDGAAHYRLGILLMGDGQLDAAAASFGRAGELGFQPGGVAYRLARIYARQGRSDEAIAQLEALAAGGFNQSQLIDGEADFMSIRDDERFVAAAATIRAARYPCDADPRAHAFDFWIGEWDVYAGGQLAGTNSVYPILGHCAISENWTSASGSEGRSYNYFDPGYGHWRQIWIGDTGSHIEFVGEARDGGIYFTAETVNPADGSVTLHDFNFTLYENGDVRQFWAQSGDGGETWNTVWDGRYVRREGSQ